eukprot:5001246-Prymnesium_polylepis.1
MLVTLDTSQRLRSLVNTEQLRNMHCGRAGRGGSAGGRTARWRRRGDAVHGRARAGGGGRERLGRRGVCARARGA